MKITKKHRLQSRFFLFYFGLCSAIIIMFFAFFYSFSLNTLQNEVNNSLEANLASLMEQCGFEVEEMDSVSVNIQYSMGARNLLDSAELDVTKLNRTEFSDLCITLNGTEGKADLFYLYDFNDNVISFSSFVQVSPYNPEDKPWIETTQTTGGIKLLGVPETGKNLISQTNVQVPYISLFRAFFNTYGEQVGALEVAKTCKSIFYPVFSFLTSQQNEMEIFVYNSAGDMLFPYDLDGEETPYDYFTLIQNTPTNFVYNNEVTARDEVIVHFTDDFTDWRYVAVQDRDTVMEPVDNLTFFVVIAIVISLVLLVGLTYFMTYSLLRPIRALQSNIQGTQLDTLSEGADSLGKNSYVELDILNDTFYQMRQNLKTSMYELIETRQQEQKSRFLALQSQINPHFYFNMLASVIVLAEDGKNDDVVVICRNMSSMMRYISDTVERPVKLGQEIDYVKKFLYCMKVRYQSSLSYEIDIDPELLRQSVPRLLIQPIVENAVKYGTETDPPWNFSIKGYSKGDGWIIEVENSGTGFSKQALEKIRERIKNADTEKGIPELRIEGLGTLNVYLRWRLFCGEDSIFEVENTEQGHAKVSIGRKNFGEDLKSEEFVDESGI